MIGRARTLIDQNDFQGALNVLDAGAKLDPNNAFVYGWRGIANNRLSQYAQAISEFDHALQLDSKYAVGLNGRGYAYYMTGDIDRALADLNAAIAINPNLATAYLNRSLIFSDKPDFERAFADLNNATRLNPELWQAYAKIGYNYNRLQQFERALPAFDQAIRLNSSFAPPFNGRGFAYQKLGDGDRALVDFEAAIRINPNFLAPYINRGQLYLARHAPDPAIADFNNALRLNPKAVPALLGRAKAHEISGDLTGALADFEAALAIAPEHGVAMAGRDRIRSKIAMGADGSAPVTAHAGTRVALVIGNSHYQAVDKLPNPERDAKAVADAIGHAGFQTVKVLIDGTHDSIEAALKEFSAAAAGADWAVVYYAGHGIEYDGNNFMIPVDADFRSDDDIPRESVALDEILNSVQTATKLRLVILDACRANPFAADLHGGETDTSGRGLARIEPDGGTLVAFATKHGHTAADGNGQNSPFASALVRRISTPGLELSQMFRLVHDDVYASTEKQQEPFTYGQLSAQEFYFKSR